MVVVLVVNLQPIPETLGMRQAHPYGTPFLAVHVAHTHSHTGPQTVQQLAGFFWQVGENQGMEYGYWSVKLSVRVGGIGQSNLL